MDCDEIEIHIKRITNGVLVRAVNRDDGSGVGVWSNYTFFPDINAVDAMLSSIMQDAMALDASSGRSDF